MTAEKTTISIPKEMYAQLVRIASQKMKNTGEVTYPSHVVKVAIQNYIDSYKM